MQDERPEAAEVGDDRLAGFRMDAHFARQRQEAQRRLEVDGVGIGALGDRGAARLLTFHCLAQLQIGTEAPDAAVTFSPVSGSTPSSIPSAGTASLPSAGGDMGRVYLQSG